ncbi:RHS repeat-associated core domain-containing protein [Actinoallomurus bryophytorum]|uniref:RHS repeat-associated core domain-containing protein n=1 Tax=Actinoallomurus bryophytorum TaxID=1490222 RepID=UPI001154717C|nr:RHS repeat-associated core domain-containing protein [Actinoallomurus bryophytorum]
MAIVAAVAVLVALVAVQVPSPARADTAAREKEPVVHGKAVTERSPSPDPIDAYTLNPGQVAKRKPTFPGAGTAEVDVSGGQPARVGSLPVTIAAAQGAMRVQGQTSQSKAASARADGEAVQDPPRRVRMEMLGQDWVKAVGGVGYAFRISRSDGLAADGPVRVSLDYSGFRHAFAGNFADRLQLVRLPGCAVTTPAEPRCSAAPLQVESVVNDLNRGVISADVDTGAPVSGLTTEAAQQRAADGEGTGAVYALTTSASGSAGDYRATDLSPSGKWASGGGTGSFTYSYPVPTPPSVGGSAPSLAFSYDSGSVDGRTAGTNTQASWVGMGWELGVGYIERKYRSCADDGHDTWGDLCWESPDKHDGESGTNAADGASYVISVAGQGGEMVKTAGGDYKVVDHPEWRIEHRFDGHNADETHEWWRITLGDGTQYWMGYGEGPGADGATRSTHSNWVVPVVGDDAGEPHNDVAPESRNQTWRWNLDRVIDRNENSQYYYWVNEVNNYKRFASGNIHSYDRGGYLEDMYYGSNTNAADDQLTGWVHFTVVNRCVERTVKDDPYNDPYSSEVCPGFSSSPDSYPDVPVDQMCSSSSCSKYSPTFFSTYRLDKITTYTRALNDTGAADWDNVSKIFLRFKYANPTGTTDAVLWLDHIRLVGAFGDDVDEVALPVVNFNVEEQWKWNRVDYNESAGQARMWMPRIGTVLNGMGGQINVTLGRQNPCPNPGDAGFTTWKNNKENNWDNNKEDCFPSRYKPEGGAEQHAAWHKFLLKRVDEVDNVTGAATKVTRYEYDLSKPGWGHNRDYEQPQTAWDWNDWRGYGAVRTIEGNDTANPDELSVATTTYFQGLDNDPNDDGTHKTAVRTDYESIDHTDHLALRGNKVQERHWRMTSAWDADPANRTYAEIASQRFDWATYYRDTWDGPGAHNAYLARQTGAYGRTKLTDGTFRQVESHTRYSDYYGAPLQIDDYGELGVSDNTCTKFGYAVRDDADFYLWDFTDSAETRAGDDCDATDTLLSKTVTYYDGATSAAANDAGIHDGNATQTQTWADASHYSVSDATYDDYGRVLTDSAPHDPAATSAQIAARTSTTTYSPAVNWPLTVAETHPLGGTTTTYPSRADGQPNQTIDVNGKTATLAYDDIRRITSVTLPGDAAHTPSYQFAYLIPGQAGGSQPTGPMRVSTSQLQDGTTYLTSYAYNDGLGRVRQTQEKGTSSSRSLVSTVYDSRGLVFGTSLPYQDDTGAAGAGMVAVDYAQIPSFTATDYDPMQRPVDVKAYRNGTMWRHTTTAYAGDSYTVTPPQGSQRTYWTDVAGNTTKVREFGSDGATYDTSYTYDKVGNLTGITDASGNVTGYSYDLLDRRISENDPDSGSATTTYDLAGRMKSATDPRGQKITYSYDSLDRQTDVWAGEENTGTRLAAFTYDTLAKGQLTSATRYSDGNAYTSQILGYDDGYRPTGKRITIPGSEGALANTYDYAYTYTTGGAPASITYPGAGGLPAEKVTTTYNDLGLPNTLTSDWSDGYTYVKSTAYNIGARNIAGRSYGPAGGITRAYDYTWDRYLPKTLTTTSGADTPTPTTVQDDGYSYDLNDNLTDLVDRTTVVGGVAKPQHQCFGYDGWDRLKDAWTTTNTCSTGSSAANNEGPDPYKQAWTYDRLGNIKTFADDGVTKTYFYATPGAGVAHPNAQTSITTSTGGADTYTYDAAGNQKTRTIGGVSTGLEWNELAQLSKTTTGGQATSYIYDTDGNRLLRKDPTSTTLYLDGMELQATGSTVTATRYYTSGDATVALRKTGDAAPTWLLADTQGSAQIAIEGWTGAAHRQRYTPYGAHRGDRDDITATEHGFLNHVEDSGTGLDQIGARYYDPTAARFISPDPLQKLDDPQQRNPYSYARNNPATFSDPTGLIPQIINPCSYLDCSGLPSGKPPTPKGSGGSSSNDDAAAAAAAAAKAKLAAAKAQIRNAAMGLLRILSEELGITDGFNCFVHGDTGACVNTAINVLSSSVGGLIGKVLAKYGAPWRLAKGFKLGKRLWGLASELFTSVKEFIKASKAFKLLRRACNSFVAGTQVRLANGKHKPIEKIKPGDKVLATDPKTGKTRPEPVLAAFGGTNYTGLIKITIDTDGKRGHHTGIIIATEHHKFWDPARHAWTRADQLAPRTALRTPSGGPVQVVAATRYPSHPVVRDLTIAKLHTFYVEVGATPVLVHNELCGTDADALQHWDRGRSRTVEDSANYHLDKHGKGRSFAEYTQEAKSLWDRTPQDSPNRVPWKLWDGREGIKIRGGLRGGEGIYTPDGKIVTWHD